MFGFLFLILIFSSLSFAQIKSQASIKIAVIDTNIFNDTEKGIKKFVKAEDSYNIEHYQEHSLTKKINELENEINYLLSQNKPINEKYVELQKLRNELENAQAESKAEHKRKYSIVVEPVNERIRSKLDEFNKLHGYALVVDKSNGSILIDGGVEDITEKFIRFCNESFEKEEPR